MRWINVTKVAFSLKKGLQLLFLKKVTKKSLEKKVTDTDALVKLYAQYDSLKTTATP